MLRVTTILALLVIPVLCSAMEIWVPDDQPTIQAAMDAAAEGDSVVLRCGTYFEWDIQYKPNTTLRSENGDPSCVTIDAGGKGRCLHINATNWQGAANIQGITFTGGHAEYPEGGGAILWEYCEEGGFNDCIFIQNHTTGWTSGGAVVISWACRCQFWNCTFIDNSSSGAAAVSASAATVDFLNCDFFNNESGGSAGAVYAGYGIYGSSAPYFEYCRFIENIGSDSGAVTCSWIYGGSTGHAGRLSRLQAPRENREAGFRNCTFSGNTGSNAGAIYFFWTFPPIEQCSFLGNSATTGGALHYESPIVMEENRDCSHISNCSIIGNTAQYGSAIASEGHYSPSICNSIIFGNGPGLAFEELWMFPDAPVPELTCTVIYGNEGGDWVGRFKDQLGHYGNLDIDPGLCGDNGPKEAYLRGDSPCAEGNNPECGQIGAWGVGCTAARTTSWSQLKSMY